MALLVLWSAAAAAAALLLLLHLGPADKSLSAYVQNPAAQPHLM
jgi:hypothetical protein